MVPRIYHELGLPVLCLCMHLLGTARPHRPLPSPLSIPSNPSGLLPTLPPRSSCPTDLRAPLSLPPCGPPSLFCHPTDLQPSFYPPTDRLRFFLFASLSCLLMVLALTQAHAKSQNPFTFKEKTKNPGPLSLPFFFSPLALFIPLRRAENPKTPLLDCSQMQLRIRRQNQGWARLPAPHVLTIDAGR